MTFQFRPAVRENVNVVIGLAGGTGSGKTFSGMRLAKGISGDKPFAVIDTENRRALHYADQFRFDCAELHEPFNPLRYADAITAADDAGYGVIVVDSMSHSWAGTGGVLDLQEAEFQRLGGKESSKMLSWAKPKAAHKKMVSRLLQVKAHLILCFRAEPKVEMVKDPATGKTQVVAKQSLVGLDGWLPICDKSLPFELTVSFLMMAQNPGIGLPIKLQQQHKALFPSGRLIDEECGERLAQWAEGTVKAPAANVQNVQTSADPVIARLQEAAAISMEALLKAWGGLSDEERNDAGSEFGRIKRSVKKSA